MVHYSLSSSGIRIRYIPSSSSFVSFALAFSCLLCFLTLTQSTLLRASKATQQVQQYQEENRNGIQDIKGVGMKIVEGSGVGEAGTRTGIDMMNGNNNIYDNNIHAHGSGSGGLEYAIERQEHYFENNPSQNPNKKQIENNKLLYPMSPPSHPYLSKGSFSITHGNTYQSDTSPYTSFTAEDAEKSSILYDELNDPDFPSDPITLVYTNDNKVIWGSTFKKIMKVQRDLPNGELRIIGTIDRSSRHEMVERNTDNYRTTMGSNFLSVQDNNSNNNNIVIENIEGKNQILYKEMTEMNSIQQVDSEFNVVLQQVEHDIESSVPNISEKKDNFHGAYSLVDIDNIFYTTYPERIEAYTDSIPGDSTSAPVRLPNVVLLPKKASAKPNAYFRGLSMTHDGYLIFATSNGFIGAVDRHSMETVAVLDLAEAIPTEKSSKFSENFSSNLRQNNPGVTFNIDDITKEVEISNNIAVDEKGGIYVVTSKAMNRIQWEPKDYSTEFTDGGNIGLGVGGRLFLDWSTPYKTSETLITGRLGRGSGTSPTIIGNPNSRQFVCIGDGSTMMNVNFFDTATGELAGSHPVTFGDPNAITSTTEQSLVGYEYKIMVTNNNYRSDTTLQRFFASPFVDMNEEFIAALPVVLGDAPKGLEQFEINPITNEVKSVWTNKDISIPNGISILSIPNRIVYGIGKRDSTNNNGNNNLNGWTLEGVNWDTGETLLTVPYGRGVVKNSFYAGAEIGPDGEIISGTLGGLVRFRRPENL